MRELQAPELPPYVLSLIVVAAGGESKSVRERLLLAHSAALRYTIEYAGALPSVGSNPFSNTTVRRWLDLDRVPTDLFEFCARLLDGIDMRVRGRHRQLLRAEGDVPTSFDRSAMLALAQVIDSVGAMRNASDTEVGEAFIALANRQPLELQKLLVENYLGNVLHDYFDACEIRAEFPRLPVRTEHELRVRHGRNIAEAVFAVLPDSGEAAAPEVVQTALREMVGLIWLAERSLDDH